MIMMDVNVSKEKHSRRVDWENLISVKWNSIKIVDEDEEGDWKRK